jgi:hypothetical protein
MTVFRLAALSATLAVAARAQAPQDATPVVTRPVQGTTIISKELPAADLTVRGGFRFVGSQAENLFGNALAEQYFFVKGPVQGQVEAFCWVQFEHFLPTNSRTYNYQPIRTVDIGGLQFIYDVKGWADYHVTTTDSGSDGAAGAALLARHHLMFPTRAVRVRMFHLPTADHRTELMIIYGEAVPDADTTITGVEGVPLDSAHADAARRFVDHARQVLSIRVH